MNLFYSLLENVALRGVATQSSLCSLGFALTKKRKEDTLLLFKSYWCEKYFFTARNLALYGRATQSDLHGNPWAGHSLAQNAIDGNRDSHFHHGSCTHTGAQTKPWWRVDLLRQYTITSVAITNRGDYAPERINGAEIHIGSSLLDNGNHNRL